MHGILLQTKDCCVHVCVCLCSACFLSMMSWWYMSHVSPTTMLLVDQQCELPRRWRAISQALVISQSLCAYRRIMMTEEVKYCFMVCKDEWHAWWWGNVCRLFQVSSFYRRKSLDMLWFLGVIIHIKLCHYRTGDAQILILPTANCNWDTSHSNTTHGHIILLTIWVCKVSLWQTFSLDSWHHFL